MSTLSAGLSGVAGEYFVAAELSRRGYVASITLRNTRGIDILVSNRDATRSVGVQVKCTQGNFNSWLVKKLDSGELASNLFFVFVSMNGLGEPAYYVVPKEVVAEQVCGPRRQVSRSMGHLGPRRPAAQTQTEEAKSHSDGLDSV